MGGEYDLNALALLIPVYIYVLILSNKILGMLVRQGVEVEDFTDDVLGCCLDVIYAQGVEIIL